MQQNENDKTNDKDENNQELWFGSFHVELKRLTDVTLKVVQVAITPKR